MVNTRLTLTEACFKVKQLGFHLTWTRSTPRMYIVKATPRTRNSMGIGALSKWEAIQIAMAMAQKRRALEEEALKETIYQYQMSIVPDNEQARQAVRTALGWHPYQADGSEVWLVRTLHQIPEGCSFELELVYGEDDQGVRVSLEWP